MKTYVKPSIDVATLASSTPIATLSCTGDNQADWELIETFYTEATGSGVVDACINYTWDHGSN